MRVLIADDDYVSRSKLKSILGKYGHCDTVPNGDSAFSMFERAHEEGIAYDLVSMDILMPDPKAGQDAIKNIRAWEKKNKKQPVHIIVISQLKDSANILSSKDDKDMSYLIKPISPPDISEALEKLGITL